MSTMKFCFSLPLPLSFSVSVSVSASCLLHFPFRPQATRLVFISLQFLKALNVNEHYKNNCK